MLPSLQSLPLEVYVFVLVFAALAIRVLATPARRRHRVNRVNRDFRRLIAARPPSDDAADQLRAVMTGSFSAKSVLSRTEAKVMAAAEAAIREAGLPWRVLAQVALGEVLSSPDDAAFRAINAKRVDLLIMSAGRMPLAAIEFQGTGHWQGNAPARDAVKKEALRRAGVGYIEITPSHGMEDMRREIERLATIVTPAGHRPVQAVLSAG